MSAHTMTMTRALFFLMLLIVQQYQNVAALQASTQLEEPALNSFRSLFDKTTTTAAPKPPTIGKQLPTSERTPEKPHIVIILIDDMGVNDVSLHGSNQILTPNLDAVGYNGIILQKHYVPNLCTPSRAALMTGRYPSHTGMQHSVIINDEPWGLPLEERLMPELFREAGYATTLVGKWHLGFWQEQYTPLYRGFDHHYGYYSGYIDYYDHTLNMLNRNYSAGLDFRRDLKPWPEANGSYATDIFTDEALRVIQEHDTEKPLFLMINHLAVHTGNEDNPMQALPEELQKFSHIKDLKRRQYAGMLSRLDRSVGLTMTALAERKMLDNSIVLVYSDNGAPTLGIHSNAGSNHPYRGQKESPWEGGIRSAAFLWSSRLVERSYISQQVVHAIDWFPTLAGAAGIHVPKEFDVDGVNLWEALSNRHLPEPRRLLHVLDNVSGYTSYMNGRLKYINGSTFNGDYDHWLGELDETEKDPAWPHYAESILSSLTHNAIQNSALTVANITQLRSDAIRSCPQSDLDSNLEIYRCEPFVAPCYFDLEVDPCERYNLAKLNPLQVKFLEKDVAQYLLNTRPSARIDKSDPRCDPALHGNTWQWWSKNHSAKTSLPTQIIIPALTVTLRRLWSTAVRGLN